MEIAQTYNLKLLVKTNNETNKPQKNPKSKKHQEEKPVQLHESYSSFMFILVQI